MAARKKDNGLLGATVVVSFTVMIVETVLLFVLVVAAMITIMLEQLRGSGRKLSVFRLQRQVIASDTCLLQTLAVIDLLGFVERRPH